MQASMHFLSCCLLGHEETALEIVFHISCLVHELLLLFISQFQILLFDHQKAWAVKAQGSCCYSAILDMSTFHCFSSMLDEAAFAGFFKYRHSISTMDK